MKHLKKIAATALAAAALTALLGAGSASATTLEVGGVTQNGSINIEATLQSGVSALLKDTFGFSINTCTSSEMKGSTKSPYTGATVTAPISTLTYASCVNPVTVHKGGTLHVSHIKNTTNGTVTSSGTEVTTGSPYGTLNCKTEGGTHLGNVVGSRSGHASIVIHSHLSCSGISAIWDATYTVTSPTGLGVSA